MKQPKKLTRYQKIKLSKKGHKADDYLLLTEDAATFTVISKQPNDNGTYDRITVFK